MAGSSGHLGGTASPAQIVRAANARDDAAACAAIYAYFVEETPVSFEEVPPTTGEMAARIEAASATHDWLVLERDGEVVGYAYAAPHRERVAYRWAVDTSVYIAMPHQGSGVGRALYTELLTRLREQRFQVACAGITLPNDASVGIHESFGFGLVGVYRRIGWKLGAWHDVGWWQLELAPAVLDPSEPLPSAR
jgi:phosphinothricin acetyltransferase